eukprot:31113-Pelagococcus_subviridis.AAC.4
MHDITTPLRRYWSLVVRVELDDARAKHPQSRGAPHPARAARGERVEIRVHLLRAEVRRALKRGAIRVQRDDARGGVRARARRGDVSRASPRRRRRRRRGERRDDKRGLRRAARAPIAP